MEGSGGFVVRFELTNLGSEGFEVRFFQIWAWVRPISGQKGSKFGHFARFERVRSLVLVDEPGFERVRHVRFETVRSSLYLGSIQH